MQIKDMGVGFYESGKIKIGCAGELRKSASGKEYHQPKKLDHFIVTTNERGPDGNFKLDPIMAKLTKKGPNGEAIQPRDIPVRLIFDDIEDNFDSSYSFYQGSKCLCRGDGGGKGCAERRKYTKTDKGIVRLTGEVERVDCPCDLLDPTDDGRGNRCKPYGILMCVLAQSDSVGGVYKFRTTSRHTIRSITTSLRFILGCTNGVLAGLPLTLTVAPRQVQTPAGQKSIVHIVNIEYRGGLESLQAKALEIARVRSQSQIEMRQIRKSLALITMKDSPADEAAVAEEFHPETIEVQVEDITGQPEAPAEPRRVMDAESPPADLPLDDDPEGSPASEDLDAVFREEVAKTPAKTAKPAGKPISKPAAPAVAAAKTPAKTGGGSFW